MRSFQKEITEQRLDNLSHFQIERFAFSTLALDRKFKRLYYQWYIIRLFSRHLLKLLFFAIWKLLMQINTTKYFYTQEDSHKGTSVEVPVLTKLEQ